MNEALLKFAADKLVPLALVAMGGVAYLLKLPDAYCAAVAAAGLVAFQIDRKSSPQS